MSFPPEAEEAFLPIHVAVSNKDFIGLKALLNQSLDSINSRDPWNCTPLHIAIQQNDLRTVQVLLSYGADSDLPVPDDYSELIVGTNSLSLAAGSGHVKVLELLLENSDRLTSKSLYVAAESGGLECVELILSWLAKREAPELNDRVLKAEAIGEALRIAAAGWRSDIVKVLLRDVQIETRFLNEAFLGSIVDEDELDDFHVVNSVPRKTPVGKKMRLDTIKLLLDAGADVNARGELHGIQGMSPLHQTSRMGIRAEEVFALLLERRPDVNHEDEDGQTPLFQAVLADDVHFAEELIEKGAIVGHTDKEGRTALHMAMGNLTLACKPIVALVLDHGTDVSALTQKGDTVLHLAAHHGNAAAVEILLPLSKTSMLSARNLTSLTPLHSAADGHESQRCIDVVHLLLSKGVDINECTNAGYTLLHLALTGYTLNKIEFISFLLENGADVDGYTNRELPDPVALRLEGKITCVDAELPRKVVVDTPLHLALDEYRADFAIVCLLLESGADLEAQDVMGRTALLRCVVGYDATPLRLDIAQELIRRGANVEAVDDLGNKFDVDIWCVWCVEPHR